MNLAESILIKLISEGHVGNAGRDDRDYWPHNGDVDEHPLGEDELVYLRDLTERHHP